MESPLNGAFFWKNYEKNLIKLYFTNDFSSENVQKLQGEGWYLRNAQLAKNDSFVEQADEYGGDIPDWYPKQNKVKGSNN